jgi:formimidoylglutamate deiminase
MKRLFAQDALLPDGWTRDVRIDMTDNGQIVSVAANAAPEDAETISAPLLPGMPNAHSHAFQRAMSGLTSRRGTGGDDFWAWRDVMYRFLERITPDDLAAIAAQLYIEMLESGYTSVAEFHYLHHDPAGVPYKDRTEMAQRILASAQLAGIGLTLLTVFYAHGNFGGLPAHRGQRRFLNDVASFNRLAAEIRERVRGQRNCRFGIAPHSLRAVTPAELSDLTQNLALLDGEAPVHIHAAEQRREVEDCIAWSGQRPIQWLLSNAELGPRWCLVHATHMNPREAHLLSTAGAVVCVCPTTEADLGDGIFHAGDFLAAAGTLAIGGDSHVGVDPFAELRQLEYSQRLAQERRNVLAPPGESAASHLWRTACMGGAQALGQPVGAIAAGKRADLVTLDMSDPALAGLSPAAALEAAVFGPARERVRDVMVAGHWIVRDGRHPQRESVNTRYLATLKTLLAH